MMRASRYRGCGAPRRFVESHGSQEISGTLPRAAIASACRASNVFVCAQSANHMTMSAWRWASCSKRLTSLRSLARQGLEALRASDSVVTPSCTRGVAAVRG
jgi:hypothetical protein